VATLQCWKPSVLEAFSVGSLQCWKPSVLRHLVCGTVCLLTLEMLPHYTHSKRNWMYLCFVRIFRLGLFYLLLFLTVSSWSVFSSKLHCQLLLFYSQADSLGFYPTGTTRCTDQGEIWQGGADHPAKFHLDWLRGVVYSPKTEIWNFTNIIAPKRRTPWAILPKFIRFMCALPPLAHIILPNLAASSLLMTKLETIYLSGGIFSQIFDFP